ncbi:MAG: hypothetical protein HYV08_08565 [Deltaproteobacteria bacterium]|nr:hypothetical protein [Deltaproteobacteria bacterium]MBI3077615.1 hypothetical protein [Deltaproteobacteria bacterium]
MGKKLWWLSATAIVTLSVVLLAASAATAAPFYQGKTIRFIVGFAAGGGFDTYTRAIARHIGRHIPGNPTTIVENKVGAGSLIAANFLYKASKPDGLTVGNFIGGLMLAQVLGRPGMEFDGRKFEWIGVPVKDSPVCALTTRSGITSADKWFAAKELVKLGGTAPGSTTDDVPRILKAAIGLPLRVIEGYGGTAKIRLAADAGEIDGGCWAWESIKVTWRKGLDTGDVVVVLQTTPERHPDLPLVPTAIELAKTEEARQLLQVGVHGPAAITRPYALPPGTPKERVQILRKAFMDTLKDPEFLTEAKKAKLDIDPVTGEQVAKIVASYHEMSPALLAKLKEILLPKK